MVLREHQFITLLLSLHYSFSSSKAKLAPPASSTHPLACKLPFSTGMIACPSLVEQLLAQREEDEPLARGGASELASAATPTLTTVVMPMATKMTSHAVPASYRTRGMCGGGAGAPVAALPTQEAGYGNQSLKSPYKSRGWPGLSLSLSIGYLSAWYNIGTVPSLNSASID